jgi:hypothetical protein
MSLTKMKGLRMRATALFARLRSYRVSRKLRGACYFDTWQSTARHHWRLRSPNGRVICHGVTSTEEGALYAMANLSSLADTVAIRRCNTQAVADEMLKKDLMYDGPASDSL